MGDAFEQATAVMFAGPHGPRDVTYTPAGGVPVHTRALITAHDPDVTLLGANVRSPGWEVRLAVAAVPLEPPKDSTITDGTRTYTVRSVKHGDHRLQWVCDCRAVPN